MASELQALVDRLAERIGRAVMIDDKHGRAEAYSALQDHADPLRMASILRREVPADAAAWAQSLGIAHASAPVRLPPNPDVGAESRLVIPLRHEGLLLGHLIILDPGADLSGESAMEAQHAAVEAAGILYRVQLVEGLARGRERELLRDLLADDASLRRQAEAALREEGLLATGPLTTLMVVRSGATEAEASPAWSDALGHAIEHLRRRVAPGHALGLVRFDHALALVVADNQAALIERARQLRHSAAAASTGERVVVGLGGALERLADAPRALRQATYAALAAARVPRFDDLASWDALGGYRALTGLVADGELDRDLLDPALVRLLAADSRGTLIHTLETYLDLAGDAQATAQRLALHRAGVYYRLAKIRDIAGLDLKDGEARLGIHLSLKLARLAGLSGR